METQNLSCGNCLSSLGYQDSQVMQDIMGLPATLSWNFMLFNYFIYQTYI